MLHAARRRGGALDCLCAAAGFFCMHFGVLLFPFRSLTSSFLAVMNMMWAHPAPPVPPSAPPRLYCISSSLTRRRRECDLGGRPPSRLNCALSGASVRWADAVARWALIGACRTLGSLVSSQ